MTSSVKPVFAPGTFSTAITSTFKPTPADGSFPVSPTGFEAATKPAEASQVLEDVLSAIENAVDVGRPNFWRTSPSGIVPAQVLANAHRQNAVTQARAKFQYQELNADELACIEHLADPTVPAPPGGVSTFDLVIGDSERSITLNGLSLITSGSGAVLLYIPGSEGGLERFGSLEEMRAIMGIRLRDPSQGYLLRQISPVVRARLVAYLNDMPPEESASVSWRPIAKDPFADGINAQIDNFQKGLKALENGELPYGDAFDVTASVERFRLETALNLAPAVSPLVTIASVQKSLPAWLVNGTDQTRQAFSSQFKAYIRSSAELEAHLEQALPPLPVFARNALIEAFAKAGLPPTLDPDKIRIRIPDKVFTPAITFGLFGRIKLPPELPVKGHHTYSLSQWALMNINRKDSDMATRLRNSRVISEVKDARLTVDFLGTIIEKLDVGAQYQRAVIEAFHGKHERAGAGLSPPVEREFLLQPYQQKILLDGWVAGQEGLGTAAQQMLETAATARQKTDLKKNGVDLQMKYVSLRIGGPLDAEGAHSVLRGLCFIQDTVSGKTLLYLPGAPNGKVVTEHENLAEARTKLAEFLRDPAMAAYAAERVAPGQPVDKLAAHLQKTFTQGQNLVEVGVNAPHHSLADFEVYGRITRLLQETHLQSRSGLDIYLDNKARHKQQIYSHIRTGLSFLPYIDVAVALYNLWEVSVDLAHRRTELDKAELVETSVMVALSALDVILSVASSPGPGSSLKRTPAQAVSLTVRKAIDSLGTRHLGRWPFRGYETALPAEAVLLKSGRDAGTYARGGQHFISTGEKTYAVYRRPGEDHWRLQKTASKHYEPPIQPGADGGWSLALSAGGPGVNLPPRSKGLPDATVIAQGH